MHHKAFQSMRKCLLRLYPKSNLILYIYIEEKRGVDDKNNFFEEDWTKLDFLFDKLNLAFVEVDRGSIPKSRGQNNFKVIRWSKVNE